MSDKEKILIGVIIALLGAVLSYRIAIVDSDMKRLEHRIERIIDRCKGP